MKTQVNKNQTEKNQANRSNLSKRQIKGNSGFQFTDNRYQADAQAKLNEMANNSPVVTQLKAFKEMANNYTQSKNEATFQTTDSPIQMKRGQKKLSPKAEENRNRLLAKQQRKYEQRNKIAKAEQGFHEMIGSDAVDQHKYPFDNFTEAESLGTAMDRLPIGMRNSESLRGIMSLPDSAHGQKGERTEVKKGEMQEALAGWQFAKDRGLRNVQSHSAQIDFSGEDSEGQVVPFDPFMSPLAGENRNPSEGDKDKWAQSNNSGSYFKHTHSKGGNKNTVGVWDKTYTSRNLESDLKGKLAGTSSDQNANVHELRVPVAHEIAREHVMAEEQIARQKELDKEKEIKWKEMEKRYRKAQAMKPKEKRGSLDEALIEDTPRGKYWRSQL